MVTEDATSLSAAQRFQRTLMQQLFSPLSEDAQASENSEVESLDGAGYPRQVQARITETLEHAFARTKARLDEGDEAVWRFLVRRFYREAPPQEILLRRVPEGFLRFLRGTGVHAAETTLPPWLLDLATFEWTELEVAYAADLACTGSPAPFDMQQPAVFSPAVRLLSLSYGVHETSRDETAPFAHLRRGATYLCVYREPVTHDVHTLTLSETAHVLLRSMMDGNAPTTAVLQAASRTATTVDTAWLEAFSALVADLLARGVVRGSHTLEESTS